MASTEKNIEGFTHPTITPIVGQPSFEILQGLKLHLSTNTAYITSHLENVTLGLLWLCVSNQVYNTLSTTVFVPPANPVPVPVILAGATQFQIAIANETHIREARIFHNYNNTDKGLKQQLLGAVDDTFTRALKIYIHWVRKCNNKTTSHSPLHYIQKDQWERVKAELSEDEHTI